MSKTNDTLRSGNSAMVSANSSSPMRKRLRVPFGERDGRLYSPSEVARGKECNCVCPDCRTVLVANQGERKTHYFSHWHGSDCPGGFESAVHRMAKQVIEDAMQIWYPTFETELTQEALPGYSIVETVRVPSSLHQLASVQLERSAEGLRPDIVASLADGRQIYIEVHVTNPVTDEKRVRFADRNMIEIHLGHLSEHDLQDMERFRNEVLRAAPRDWVACQLYRSDIETAASRLNQCTLEAQQRHQQEQERKQKLTERREKMRQQYQAPLAALHEMAKVGAEAERMRSLWTTTESTRSAMQHRLGLSDWPATLNFAVDGDWMFNVHRSIWQSYIYESFIATRTNGSSLDASVVTRQVISTFGLLDWVAELLNLKNRNRKRQRASGQQLHGDSGIWFLDAQENTRIPSPDKVVLRFLESLVKEGLLLTVESGSGQFVVCENGLPGLLAQRALEAATLRLQEEEAWQRKQEEIALYQARSQFRQRVARQKQDDRIQSIIRAATCLWKSGLEHALRCDQCGNHRSENIDGNCRICGDHRLRKVDLTDDYLSTLRYRLRSLPNIALQKKTHL